MTVYLDNAATTKPCAEAVNAVYDAMTDFYGNPSSLHGIGLAAEQKITEARKAVAAALVCDPDCVVFTSGATEANNAGLIGAARIYGKRKKKIVISGAEHPSVYEPVNYLEEKEGFAIVRVNPDRRGEIDPDVFMAAVDKDTCLASCMLINNETGAIHPVKRIFSRIKRDHPECVTHCDAVQGFLKTPVGVSALFADIVVVSGHKAYAPKGIGAMYIKKGMRLSPILTGGGQEKGFRSGTEAVPLICGFGAAVRAQLPELGTMHQNAEEINAYIRKKLSAFAFVTINSPSENVSPFIVNFSAKDIRSEIMLHFLESKGVYVSSGSACAKGKSSPTLLAMGIPDKVIDSSLRVSISKYTTKGEIDILMNALQEGYMRIAKVT